MKARFETLSLLFLARASSKRSRIVSQEEFFQEDQALMVKHGEGCNETRGGSSVNKIVGDGMEPSGVYPGASGLRCSTGYTPRLRR